MTRNLTVGPPTRLIVLFTLPLLVGNVFQQLYQFTDAAVVGRLVGLDGLGAVGATNGLVFLLIGFTWGSSAGLAIPTARATCPMPRSTPMSRWSRISPTGA